MAKSMSDIVFFAKEFLPHMLTYEIPEFHKEMYGLLTTEQRLVMAAPRGFAKSTISSVIYPIFLACSGIRKKDVCIVSASETLAVEMLRRVKRELESNQKILQLFGNLKTEKWSETHFITKTGVQFRARGAGGQIRGFRPDCLILDDIETDELVESEEQRKKLKEWLFKACLNTLLPEGQFILIGSIIHPLSLLSDLLLVDNGWTKRKYQAYKEAKQESGYELWPAMWPHDKLQVRKKEIGSWAFSSEYLNDPISDETAPIKPHQIRYWKELPQQLSCVISVDPAYSEDEKADFKVASLIGIDQQLNRYLVSYVRTHASTGEFIDSVLNLWMQNRGKVTSIGVPSSGVEKQFFKSFVDRANSRKLYPPVAELKNSFITSTGNSVRSKKARITAALQPLFESGKYYIHDTHLEALDELLTIGSSRWDDLVDTMCYAEQLLTPVFVDSPEELNSGYLKVEVKPNYGY
jgi:phage terminase large subunit-like protein